MSSSIVLRFARPPSVLVYMARALYPSPGLVAERGFPAIDARWPRHRLDQGHLDHFLRSTGLDAQHGIPIIYPQVFTFRLQMAVVTHPAFSLPIWRALQIRNHLVEHRPVPRDAVLDVRTRVVGQRILEKGAEADLHTTLRSGDELVWEGITTFYYRGRHGGADPPSPLAQAPAPAGDVAARWTAPIGGGLRAARLTGDFNPIHWSNAYARRLGFRRASHHPQMVVGKALAELRLPPAAEPHRLDVWLKGPVYYGSEVTLRATTDPSGTSFFVFVDGDERPAIVGHSSAASGAGLGVGAGGLGGGRE
jgi:acyl dehydratase